MGLFINFVNGEWAIGDNQTVQAEDYTGKTVGNFDVLRRATKDELKNRLSKCAHWWCKCQWCGDCVLLITANLKGQESCKCVLTVNGYRGRNHPLRDLYGIWLGIKYRCTDPKSSGWELYGERGIRICSEWEFSFETFVSDIGPRPSKQHTIDRIDSDGDYCKENCRWATPKEQNRNLRTNTKLTAFGETKLLLEWAEQLGLNTNTIHTRLHDGATHEEALRPLKGEI